jgi:predicted dienelactone hydrolase
MFATFMKCGDEMKSIIGSSLNRLARLVAVLIVTAIGGNAMAAEHDYGVAQRTVTYVDKTRPIKASGDFGGTTDRRLDLIVWYPVPAGAPANASATPPPGVKWPLILYAHGTMGHSDNATHIVRDLVQRGYVVAAPNFPLTSSASFTKITHPDLSDVVNQTKDLSFIIDSLLGDSFFGPLIDKQKVGSMGHSLGAVTNYFAVFGSKTREPRISAVILLGAGDPVQAALSNDMGFGGSWPAPVHVPVLFLSAEKDLFARLTGGPHAAYARVPAPKYEVMVKKGAHVWFRDSTDQPADNKNPDCLFFERSAPGMVVPGCEEREPLIGPARQQEITRTAVRAFFDAYLKNDDAARSRLLGLDKQFTGQTSTLHEDLPALKR